MAIIKCGCIHEMQDNLHGKGMRVHNATMKQNWRCTCCGKEQSMGRDETKTKKEKK